MTLFPSFFVPEGNFIASFTIFNNSNPHEIYCKHISTHTLQCKYKLSMYSFLISYLLHVSKMYIFLNLLKLRYCHIRMNAVLTSMNSRAIFQSRTIHLVNHIYIPHTSVPTFTNMAFPCHLRNASDQPMHVIDFSSFHFIEMPLHPSLEVPVTKLM